MLRVRTNFHFRIHSVSFESWIQNGISRRRCDGMKTSVNRCSQVPECITDDLSSGRMVAKYYDQGQRRPRDDALRPVSTFPVAEACRLVVEHGKAVREADHLKQAVDQSTNLAISVALEGCILYKRIQAADDSIIEISSKSRSATNSFEATIINATDFRVLF